MIVDVTRRYPHRLREGVVFPTGWASTDSVHYETCPRCGAEPGFYCVTPSGREGRDLVGGSHGERQLALKKNHPEIDALSIRGRIV